MALTQAQLGLRIARARERAGLTQAQLGQALGLSDADMQALEAGDRPVFSFELATIARLTERELSWFLALEQSSLELQLRAAAERQPDAREPLEWLADFARDDRLLRDLLPDETPAPRPGDRSAAIGQHDNGPLWAGRAQGDADRAASGAAVNGPLDPFAFLAERRGVTIVRKPLGERLDGVYGHEGRRAVLLVNSRRSAASQRYVVAHLYGHHLVRPRLDDVVVDRDALMEPGPVEDAANAYAGCLLVPLGGLERFLDGRSSQGPLRPEDVRLLAERYEVPFQATLWHLVGLGLVQHAQLAGPGAAEWAAHAQEAP